MNTSNLLRYLRIRMDAMNWWNDLSYFEQTAYTNKFYHNRQPESLTGREIQYIYVNY